MSAGKEIRLKRLFGHDGKTVIVALDHGIAGIAPLAKLGHPESLIRSVTENGADALIVTPGMARSFACLLGGVGVILRVDCGPTSLTSNWSDTKPALAVGDAVELGADAVVAMGIVGVSGESASLQGLASLASRCDRWGMVLLAEMLPGGFAASEVSTDQIGIAARIGAELGADLIKVRYTGSVESFRAVTSNCYRPVVVLGGSKQNSDQLLCSAREAIAAGARGVAVGRNVWQSEEPGSITSSLAKVVHG